MVMSKPTHGKFLVLAAYSNTYHWNGMSNSHIFLNNPTPSTPNNLNGIQVIPFQLLQTIRYQKKYQNNFNQKKYECKTNTCRFKSITYLPVALLCTTYII